MSGGKGSAPRPYSVPKDTFDQNFDRIFDKKEPVDSGSNLLEEQKDDEAGNLGSDAI